jgi:restriction system protein
MKRPMWMVRAAAGGRLADEFLEKRLVAIGWSDIGDLSQYKEKPALVAAVRKQWPAWRDGTVKSSASQLIRFRDELAVGDRVITYDSSTRTYHLGTIAGEYVHAPGAIPPYENIRQVQWESHVDRDKLSVDTRKRLGPTLTLFKVPETAAQELEIAAKGIVPQSLAQPEEQEDEENLLDSYKSEAFEITKDRINRLDWEQLQELVAGLLRAMGYKTRVAPRGPDRGVDVMASPDGFGFESPRIMVEVKHRNDAIGAQELRSFIGGRHKDDKGMYVSTGGFTKDARYEADRANIPVFLMDLDELVKAIYRNYEKMDIDTQTLVPLKKIYWPT